MRVERGGGGGGGGADYVNRMKFLLRVSLKSATLC